jgi:hypothetical protein
MNNFVGLSFIILGSLLVLTGILLAVSELISGRHRTEGSRGRAMGGLNWEGITAVINAAKGLVQAMGDWPLPALFVILGLIFMGTGVYILAANPISGV